MACGVNVTQTLQELPVIKVPTVVQEFVPVVTAKSPGSAPVGELTPVIVKLALAGELLVSITDCAVLVVPTFWPVEKVRFPESVGFGPTPVPETVKVCGLPVSVSLTLRVVESEPGDCGVNFTVIVQVVPFGVKVTLVQVFVWEKSVVSELEILLMVKLAEPLFDTVITSELLPVWPTFTLPMFREVYAKLIP